MSIPVITSHYMSIAYVVVGNTYSEQSFHVFRASLPEYGALSTRVIPSPLLSGQDAPEPGRQGKIECLIPPR